MAKQTELVVESVVEDDGRRFRPSDWIERLSTTVAEFGPDHRLHYDDSVRPQIVDGQKCLVVNTALRETNPAAYKHIIDFIRANGLRYHEK